MNSLNASWQLAGLAALVAACALIAWFFSQEGRNEQATQRRIQRDILNGSLAGQVAVASVPLRLASASVGRWEPDVPWAGDTPLPPPLPPLVPPRAWEEPDLADAPTDAPMDGGAETYCPACVVVALENHEAYAPGEWQGNVYVALSAVITRGMLDGSARAVWCAHHRRALDDRTAPATFGPKERRVARWGLETHVYHLVVRARHGRSEGAPDGVWRLESEDGGTGGGGRVA